MRASWLVRTSSLYFHKARVLRHTSALLKKWKKKNTEYIVDFYKHAGILGIREKCGPKASASPHFSSVLNYS